MMLNTETGLDGEYVPSPLARVRKQVADYEASGGVEGATLEGGPVVILTSVGARSGKVRKNPVMRIVDGDRYVAVASAGGAPKNLSWYTNLVSHPTVPHPRTHPHLAQPDRNHRQRRAFRPGGQPGRNRRSGS
jgi:F420H(2)-dependent quinone reductase